MATVAVSGHRPDRLATGRWRADKVELAQPTAKGHSARGSRLVRMGLAVWVGTLLLGVYANGSEVTSARMPWVVGQDLYSAHKTLRKLGVNIRYEQVSGDTSTASQFTVAAQVPDSGKPVAAGQEVVLRFNCSKVLYYLDDFALPLLGDFRHQVSLYRATRPPEPIMKPAAVYPEALLEHAFNGEVRVEAFIDYDGTVLASRLLESSGYRQADSAALAAAMQAVFSPARYGDNPVRVWFPLQYRFVYQPGSNPPAPARTGTQEGY